METIPEGVETHLLPSGAGDSPNLSIGYGRPSRMAQRMEDAYAACTAYLDAHPEGGA
jgi:NTE family protein